MRATSRGAVSPPKPPVICNGCRLRFHLSSALLFTSKMGKENCRAGRWQKWMEATSVGKQRLKLTWASPQDVSGISDWKKETSKPSQRKPSGRVAMIWAYQHPAPTHSWCPCPLAFPWQSDWGDATFSLYSPETGSGVNTHCTSWYYHVWTLSLLPSMPAARSCSGPVPWWGESLQLALLLQAVGGTESAWHLWEWVEECGMGEGPFLPWVCDRFQSAGPLSRSNL